MKVQLSGIVEDVFRSDRGTTIITVLDNDGGKVKFSTKNHDLSKIKRLVPYQFEMVLVGKSYNGKDYLEVDQISVKAGVYPVAEGGEKAG